MAAQFNADGTIKGYADLQVRVEGISTTVTNNKSATDSALEWLRSSLAAEVQDRKDADSARDTTFATYREQTDRSISAIAAKWDSNGNLIGYSTTQQTADRIAASISKVEEKTYNLLDVADWEMGAYNTSGNKTASSNSIRTKGLLPINGTPSFTLTNSYWIQVYFFDADKDYISRSGSSTATRNRVTVTVPSAARYVALVLGPTGGSIAVSDLPKAGLTMIDSKVATAGDLSLYLDKDSVSWLTGSADNIVFTFDKNFLIKAKNGSTTKTVFDLRPNGDLYITGKFHGEIDDNVTIGSGTNKMFIESYGNDGARLVGKTNSTEVISLGFPNGKSSASLDIRQSKFSVSIFGGGMLLSDDDHLTIQPFFGMRNGMIYIGSYYDNSAALWPQSKSSVQVGGVWLDGEILKVRKD